MTTLPTLSTDANMRRAGTYAITFAGKADAGSNYSITYVDAELTVKNYPYIPLSTYSVEIADNITGGKVSTNRKSAGRGDTVTITVTPDAGYELTELTITDRRGNAIAVTEVNSSKYTFKMPGYGVEIDAVFTKINTVCPGDFTCPMYGYTDLDTSAWYHDGVHFCIEHGLMQSVGNNQFNPGGTTTRAMIVTILWRLEGKPIVSGKNVFTDVAEGMYYTEAVKWAAAHEIVSGYGNGKFGPENEITREQLAAILWRYAKYKGYDVSVGESTNILSYKDFDQVSSYAIPALQWVCGEGIMSGYDGYLTPRDTATRAQAAAMLTRFCKNTAE